jgi:hypothetical protein
MSTARSRHEEGDRRDTIENSSRASVLTAAQCTPFEKDSREEVTLAETNSIRIGVGEDARAI